MKAIHIYFVSLLSFIGGYENLCFASDDLCADDESTVFSCALASKFSSLCESKDSGVLTYRHGKKENIDFEVSDLGKQQGRIFYFSNTPYAGGGEAHIRFSRGRYTYFLYDKTIKTDNGHDFSAGIVVYRDKSKISNMVCDNDASIYQNAYSRIVKEKYIDIKTK